MTFHLRKNNSLHIGHYFFRYSWCGIVLWLFQWKTSEFVVSELVVQVKKVTCHQKRFFRQSVSHLVSPPSQPSFSALPSVFSFVMSLDTFSSIHQPDRILITFSWQAKSSCYSGKCPFSKKLSYWSNLYASMHKVVKYHGAESTGRDCTSIASPHT